MYCQRCGAVNNDNAQTCNSCGQSLILNTRNIRPGISKKTCGLATASFIMGILAPITCMITTLPAIILGIIAILKISKNDTQLKGTGFAIAGMCLPIATLPIVAFMMGILMPALAKTRQLALRIQCGENLADIAVAMQMYCEKNNRYFPTSSKWCDLLVDGNYISEEFLHCPSAEQGPCNYAMNENIEGPYAYLPGDMVLLFETYPGWNQVGGPDILSIENHQMYGCSILFVDGSVMFVKTEGLAGLRWKSSDPQTYHY